MRSNSFYLLAEHQSLRLRLSASTGSTMRAGHIYRSESRATQDVVVSIPGLGACRRMQDIDFWRRFSTNPRVGWENIPHSAESPCMHMGIRINKAIGPCAIGPAMPANSIRKRESYQQARSQGRTLVQVMLDEDAIAVLDRMGCKVAGKPSRPAALKLIVDAYMNRDNGGAETLTP